MVDGVTQPVDDTNRKTIVHEQLAATEIHLALTDEPADTHGAIRLPLDAIPAAHVVFCIITFRISLYYHNDQRAHDAPGDR